MSVLILSRSLDLHARAVSWALGTQGLAADILDLAAFPSKTTFSVTPCGQPPLWTGADTTTGMPLDLEQVRVVWARRHQAPFGPPAFSDVHPDDLANVTDEANGFATGLWHYLDGRLGGQVSWINPLSRIDRAQSKALQLELAAACGMRIPETLISNDPRAVRDFCRRQGGQLVVKPFRPKSWVDADRRFGQPTLLVDMKQLEDSAAIQLCPAIYQNLIPKKYELRVLVLGERIITARLESQAQAHSRIDWRTDAGRGTMPIAPHQLDAHAQDCIQRFMGAMGIRFGSLDLIVDEAGALIFLEINQQGQFLFLDQQCPQLNTLAEVSRFFAAEAGHTATAAWPTFADYRESEDGRLFQEQKKQAR